jgi:hypothetical protein
MSRSVARLIPALLVMGLAVTGCASSSSSSPTDDLTMPSATTGAQTPASSDDLGNGGLPNSSADPELEARVPSQLGGQPVDKISFDGDTFLSSGTTGSQGVDTLLGTIGKTSSDLTVVLAGNDAVTVFAYRIKGTSASQLLPQLVAAYQDSGELGAFTTRNVTLSGKKATQMDVTDSGTTYLYAAGDTIYVLGGGDLSPALLAEAFSKLP